MSSHHRRHHHHRYSDAERDVPVTRARAPPTVIPDDSISQVSFGPGSRYHNGARGLCHGPGPALTLDNLYRHDEEYTRKSRREEPEDREVDVKLEEEDITIERNNATTSRLSHRSHRDLPSRTRGLSEVEPLARTARLVSEETIERVPSQRSSRALTSTPRTSSGSRVDSKFARSTHREIETSSHSSVRDEKLLAPVRSRSSAPSSARRSVHRQSSGGHLRPSQWTDVLIVEVENLEKKALDREYVIQRRHRYPVYA